MVSLCVPTCHILFDAHQFPGWVFLPLDLQYFVDSRSRTSSDDTNITMTLRSGLSEPGLSEPCLCRRTIDSTKQIPFHEPLLVDYRKFFFQSRFRDHSGDILGESAEFPTQKGMAW